MQQLQQIFKIIILLPFTTSGLFEFLVYRIFLPLFRKHRNIFTTGVWVGSIMWRSFGLYLGAAGVLHLDILIREDVLDAVREYISARVTFSNSLLREEHLTDKNVTSFVKMFEHASDSIIHHIHIRSEWRDRALNLLLNYLQKLSWSLPCLFHHKSSDRFSGFSNGSKPREDFLYVVPDFRLNKYSIN